MGSSGLLHLSDESLRFALLRFPCHDAKFVFVGFCLIIIIRGARVCKIQPE